MRNPLGIAEGGVRGKEMNKMSILLISIPILTSVVILRNKEEM